MKPKRRSIATRVLIGIAIATAGTGLVAVAGVWGLHTVASAVSGIGKADEVLGQVSDARAASLGVRRFEKDFIINAGDAPTQEKYIVEWRDELWALRKGLDRIETNAGAGQEKDELAMARRAVDRYEAGALAMFAAGGVGSKLSPGELNRLLAPVKDEIRDVIGTLAKIASAHAGRARSRPHSERPCRAAR